MEQAPRLRAAQYRLAQYYLEQLQAAERAYQLGGESAVQALSLFDLEREQVQLWHAWSVAHAGQDEKASALCSAYAGACPDIYKLRLLPQDYLRWLEAGLIAARRFSDRRVELMLLLDLTETHMRVAEYERAVEYAGQALPIARLIHDEPLLALSLNTYGNALRSQRQYEEAQKCYEESLLLYEKIGDRRGMAEVLNNLGVLAIYTRKNDAAQLYLEQCLTLNREIGNQEGAATCLNNLGYLANRLEQYRTAGDYLEQALALFRVLGDIAGTAMALTNLGLAAYYQDAYALAKNYLEQSLDAAHTAGILEREILCLYRLGEVTMTQGDLISAQAYFEQSLTRDPEPSSSLLADILSNLAIIYQQLHRDDRVRPALREALEAAFRFAGENDKLNVLCRAARLWVLQGKPLQAATWLGLVENQAHPAIKMAEIKRSIRLARAECEAALSPEQFASAWEAGKCLNLDAVLAEILGELQDI
ncbi:MAG TPA: tetratricopeptide repeat protein [Ktedonobacteraceae bacterium]|jgi:tetratricopeptide (TPR) repeat protein|nr:tetratricopeptide repeat protein [Ktedonobacteraceae bacterium]